MKNKNVVLELKAYDIFDALQTHSVWIAPKGTPIPKYDRKNIRDTSEYIKLLKESGFSYVKTKRVKFCRNL